MFKQPGVILAIIALAIGLLFWQVGLAVLGLMVLLFYGTAYEWNRRSLRGVVHEWRLSEHRAFLGETLTLERSIANRKALPLPWVRVREEFPLGLRPEGVPLLPSARGGTGILETAVSLRSFETARWRSPFECTHRGYYAVGPVHLTAGDPFGFFQREQSLDKKELLIVYPRMYSLDELGLPPKDPFGDYRFHLRIFEDPIRLVGIRDYRPEDPLKRVHWKATARLQRLQVSVCEPTVRPHLLVCLNLATLDSEWQQGKPEVLEHAVSVAASVAAHGVRQKQPVGLLANGCWPESDQPLRVQASRSPDQLVRILEALAAVTPMPTTRFAALILKESARLPWGATLVLVSAILTDELRVAMDHLRGAGRKVALLLLDPDDPAEGLPGIVVYRIASSPGSEPLRFAQPGLEAAG